MKKKIMLGLAMVLCSFSLCACGDSAGDTSTENQKSMEDLLSEAKKVNADEILNDIGGNKARANSYIGSSYCITGHILEIEEEYCLVLAADTGDWNKYVHSDDWSAYAQGAMFRVYLSTDELAKLDKCENIEFVGEITGVESMEYHAIEPMCLEVTNAYLVNENVTYEGRDRLAD